MFPESGNFDSSERSSSTINVWADDFVGFRGSCVKLSFLFLMTLLLASPVYVSAQNTSKGDQENDPRREITIEGCLTKNSLNEFELVDQKGIDNLLYSEMVNLGQYVGQTVTVVGKRSAMPNTDMGIKNPQPHFFVVKIQTQSRQCQK
jgi:hypothetical protein